MKKTLITLMGVLVLCIAMVSCNNNPVTSEDAEVSFVTSVSKALNESAEKMTTGTDDISVNDYYWDYWCDTTTPDKSGVEFKMFEFRKNYEASLDSADYNTFLTDEEEIKNQKGLGTIRGLTKGNMYYFGLKGYADAERTKLMWEGYTGRNDSLESGDYKAYRISAKTYVQIHVFAKGTGSLVYDISAPYDDDARASSLGNNNDNQENRIDGYKDTYFFVSYYKIGDLKTSGTDRFDKEDEGFVSNYENTDFSKRGIYYNSKESPVQLDAGTYFFTISQNVTNLDSVVPGRKQVLIVNIIPGAVTTISGNLDSTIGVSVDWDAKKYLEVIFHTFEGDFSQNLTVSDGSTTFNSATNVTVACGTEATFTPSAGGKQVSWYINGVALDNSVLASKKVVSGTDTDEDCSPTDGYITAYDYGDVPSTSHTDDYKTYANEYGSYAYVNYKTGAITFVRGETTPSDETMADNNRYMFTVILDETKDTAESYSFTVGI